MTITPAGRPAGVQDPAYRLPLALFFLFNDLEDRHFKPSLLT